MGNCCGNNKPSSVSISSTKMYNNIVLYSLYLNIKKFSMADVLNECIEMFLGHGYFVSQPIGSEKSKLDYQLRPCRVPN